MGGDPFVKGDTFPSCTEFNQFITTGSRYGSNNAYLQTIVLTNNLFTGYIAKNGGVIGKGNYAIMLTLNNY